MHAGNDHVSSPAQGRSGCTAALALRRGGHRVTVAEKRPR
jgi:monoamine oxidase